MSDVEVAPLSVDEIDATDEGHWNHLLPDEDWALAVEEADRILEQRLAEEGLGGGAELQPIGLTPRRMSFPDTYDKNSGRIVRNQLWVNHSAECPLRVGFAESLTRWGNGGYNPRASWPMFVDPATVVTWISFLHAAFLHGPANSLGWGWEQAGYARFTRAEWLTPDGLRQLDLLAQEIVRRGIPKDAVRWLTNAQVQAIVERRDTTTRGLCDHRQIDPRNRSDAGDGYPRDVLLDWIKSYHPDFTDRTPPGTTGTLRLGDRGPAVVELQKLLNTRTNAGLDTDGMFGVATDAAVRAFQHAVGLSVDGVAGPDTQAALKTPPKSEEDELMALQIKNPVTGKLWTLPSALWSIWHYAIAARDAAIEAREVAAALADKQLSETELDRIAERVATALKEQPANAPDPGKEPAG